MCINVMQLFQIITLFGEYRTEITFCFSDVLNVHLVDVVSGGIVTTITHRRVKGPVNMIHSENCLIYTYYNDKVRRTELSKLIFKEISEK